MIGQTLGRYVILEEIGAGGMGVVYRARDKHLARDVALKVLPQGVLADETARKRFRKEAQALAKLNHTNIESVYDFDTHGSVDYLVLEYVPGITLGDKLATGALPEKEILRLGLQLAQGLAAAHAQGVVHRDLKPGNLRITPDGQLKILDFGLAKLLQPASTPDVTQSVTQMHGVAGTLPYMAPEQLRAEPADARTDIYAAGVVLYEMATAHRPFERQVPTALAADIQHKPVPPPGRLRPELSPRLEEVILKCLEKEPENRYQSAKELGVDLHRLAAPSSTYVAPRAPAPAGWRARARGWPLPAAATLVLLAVVFAFNPRGLRDRLLGRAVPGRISSLAVLPLENLSADPVQNYLADGMTEELTTDLGQIGALRVISRTSVMHYKGTRKTIPEIAGELHVDAVVEGSVERVGDQVRITAQLIEATTDRHLWARSYQREFRNALQLQDEVAQAIAQEIQVKLTPQEQSRLASSRPVDPEAYNEYLKGRYFYNQRTPESYRKASEYFQQAINKDPNYAPAWALWADTAWDPALSPAENARRAQEKLQKALQLDDSLAEVHTVIGGAKMDAWDWAGAERELRRAIELNPNYAEAHHFYSHYLMAQGRVEESFRESQRALEADPLNLAMVAHLAWHYLFARQYDQAIAQCRRTLDLDPNYQLAHIFLAKAEEQKGKYADAIAGFQKVLTLAGGGKQDLSALAGLGHAYALAGNKAEVLKIINRIRQGDQPALSSVSLRPLVSYHLAVVYLGLGDKERSLAFLKKAVDERAVPGFAAINQDPTLNGLHSDPRFQDLLRRMNLPP